MRDVLIDVVQTCFRENITNHVFDVTFCFCFMFIDMFLNANVNSSNAVSLNFKFAISFCIM